MMVPEAVVELPKVPVNVRVAVVQTPMPVEECAKRLLTMYRAGGYVTVLS